MPEKLRTENPGQKLPIRPENPGLLVPGGRLFTFPCLKLKAGKSQQAITPPSNSRNGWKIPTIKYRYGRKIPASKNRYGRKILRPVTKETAGKSHSGCHRDFLKRMQWRSGRVSGLLSVGQRFAPSLCLSLFPKYRRKIPEALKT